MSLYNHTSQSKWNLNFLGLFLVQKIIVQMPDYKADYPRLLQDKIEIIPNSINNKFFIEQQGIKANQKTRKRILAVGRLCAQKFDKLIRAFSIISNRQPDWRLTIVGEGELKSELVSLIESYDLSHCIELLPPTQNIYEHYREADILHHISVGRVS